IPLDDGNAWCARHSKFPLRPMPPNLAASSAVLPADNDAGPFWPSSGYRGRAALRRTDQRFGLEIGRRGLQVGAGWVKPKVARFGWTELKDRRGAPPLLLVGKGDTSRP